MAESKREKVTAVLVDGVAIIDGASRTHLALDAAWTKGLDLQLEHAGGSFVYVYWNKRTPKSVFRHKTLLHCTQIDFEPVPQ